MHPDRPAALADLDATARLWGAYLDASGDADGPWTVDRFATTAAYATEIAGWVAARGKRATSDLVTSYLDGRGRVPSPGDRWVLVDGEGAPVHVLRTTHARTGVLDDADEAFALAEGDGSYDGWRAVHLEYFGELCAARGERFDPARTPVVLERFEVLASVGGDCGGSVAR